ncbi:MAG: DUF975 family protein [Clostridiales bacterium]|nr:DUF975 family protein [Clostridiales bacterium]
MLVCGIIFTYFCSGSSAGNASIGSSAVLSSGAGADLGLSEGTLMGIGAAALLLIILAVIALIIIKALLLNPLQVGIAKFELNALKTKANVSDLGSGFDVSYKRNAKTMFIYYLYIVIGLIICIIPGVILIYQLRMVPYILADNPDADRKQAFAMSREMMKGNKWKSFILDLSFLPWMLLSCITCGIVYIFYTAPYIHLTHAALYEAIKD